MTRFTIRLLLLVLALFCVIPASGLNRPGFRGGCLVKVKPGFWFSRRVAESNLPQPRPVEYTQSAPAVGGG